MTIGAHSIGRRGLGDSTLNSAAPSVFISAVLDGAATFTGTVATGNKYAQALLAGVGTFSPSAVQQVQVYATLNGYATFVGTTPFLQTADPSQQMTQYRAVVVDYIGNKYASLENAKFEFIQWDLNGIHSAEFTIPWLDPKAVHIKVPEREVQIWRGNVLIAWMVMTGARVDPSNGTITVQCKGLRWYFTRRFFGKADRKNYLYNGSFETGMGYWDMLYSPIEPQANLTYSNFTHNIVTNRNVTGNKSLKIVQSGTTPKWGISLRQYTVWTVDSNIDPEGSIWTFAIWVYVENFVDDRSGNAGVGLSRYSTTETVAIQRPGGAIYNYPKPLAGIKIPIDADFPQGTWTRVEIELTQPPKAGVAEFVQVTVDAPRGTIYVDEATLTAAEKTAFYDKDQALIVKGIVDHCQDANYGKSSLNMLTNTPLTGIVRTREFWHSEHQNCGDALDEFASLYQGVDSEIEITPTTRIYTTYYPRMGIRRPDIVLEYGRNIADFSVEFDGTETANSVVVLGDGEGSDREEGGAIDATALTGGLILETVYNATPGSHIKTLDAQALRGVERFKKPVVVPAVTTYDNSYRLLERLRVGDVVPLRIKTDTPITEVGLLLPGSNTNSWSNTVDKVALDYTGTDFEAEFWLTPMTAWFHPSSIHMLAAKINTLAVNAGGWYVALNTSGTLRFTWGNGTTSFTATSSVTAQSVLPVGKKVGIKVTWVRNNGGGVWEVKFWYNLNDGTGWLQLGTTQTGVVLGVIADTNQPLRLGADLFGNNGPLGFIYSKLTLRDGINGNVVANPDWSILAPGTGTFTDGSGLNSWTRGSLSQINRYVSGYNPGLVNIDEEYRVMAVRLNPNSEQIQFTINPAATSF